MQEPTRRATESSAFLAAGPQLGEDDWSIGRPVVYHAPVALPDSCVSNSSRAQRRGVNESGQPNPKQQEGESMPGSESPITSISGVIPTIAAVADTGPLRSESGIGAVMPWADLLWYISYTSFGATDGSGTGLFSVDAELRLKRHPESVVGTFANRMVHAGTGQLIIGPHLIDETGRVRTVPGLTDQLLTATFEHLHSPGRLAYYLTMAGDWFEVDVVSLETRHIANLAEKLGIPSTALEPHFKAGFTGQGRVVVACNTYEEREFLGEQASGRLAEWDGDHWTVISDSPFYEVTGRSNMGGVIFATGWDRSSALLKVRTQDSWSTYRLPKGSHCFDHMWQTEWPRIREIETERYLMDCQAIFYEISPIAYSGKIWGIKPISTHLRVVPDFCSWRGMLVLAGNQATPIEDNYLLAGQPQAGLWLGKSDDLWQFGKPSGWGGPWWHTQVFRGISSDPYLMTGFDRKSMHLTHDGAEAVTFTIEVDFLGTQEWNVYGAFTVAPSGYVHHEFPDGFSAHWLRATVDRDCTATAYLHYT